VKPYVLGAVFARGGSKGIPRKNLQLLAGRPLIAHAIVAARAAQSIQRLVVSTDDAEIAYIARRYGAEVPFMRPAELAQDDSPEWSAWQHVIRTLEAMEAGLKIDVLVSVPSTSPRRVPADIDACVETLLQGDADAVITVAPTTRSPCFNMVTLEGGYARPVMASAAILHRRQDAPPIFDVTTVAYAAHARFVLAAPGLFAGKVAAVIIPRERAIDIDTKFDLEMARLLAARETSWGQE